MVGAYLYLTGCTVKNLIRRRVRRLREPRYLVGTIVGAVYLYLMIFRRSGRRGPMAGGPAGAMLPLIAGPIEFFGSVALLIVAAAAWVLPGLGRPLTFTRAEVQFLFTAPVSRRALLHYKLLRSQVGVLVSSVVATLVLRPSSAARGWTVMAGLWILMMAVRLHLMGVALSRRSLAQHGAVGLFRQWLPLSLVAGALGLLGVTVAADWTTLAALTSGEAVFDELRRLGSSGVAGAMLWPFRTLVRLPLSASTAGFLDALPAALGLLLLNYLWVLRSDAAFEEASADHAEQAARRRGAPAPTTRSTGAQPFVLAPTGRPETAILWKNLIQLGRYVSARTFLRVLPVVAALAILARSSGGAGGVASFVAALCVPLAVFAVLMGPQMLRNDLRQDLGNLAQLKTWPVTGPALIRGSVLAPTMVLSGVSWVVMLFGALLATHLPMEPSTAAGVVTNRLSYGAAGALVGPALILSQTVIHNGLAVLFPAWVAAGAHRTRGIDAMGQRLLMMAGIMVTLTLSVLPGALIAAALVIAGRWITGITFVVVPALVFALVIVAECWVATELLGRLLDRTDVAAVDAAD